MSSLPAIEFRGFSFRYKSQTEPTLHDIDLTIGLGEKILILGPSGSGKSTLANCINGLVPFSFEGDISGSCVVMGQETRKSSLFELSKHVGTVLQDSDAQFVGLSVGEDIAFALENRNTPRQEMLTRVREAAEIVGMEDYLVHVPYQLSGGQKQKVSLAGVLHDDVDILIFDEPLASLDPRAGMGAIELIDAIHQRGKTVVIIEHRLEDVLYRNIDRIIMLDKGRIVFNGIPDNLLASDTLERYGIREPLYITALRYADCHVTEADRPSSIHTLDVSRYADKLKEHQRLSLPPAPSVTGEMVVSVEGMSFAYEKDLVVKDVSFSIRKGEKVAFIGKNGAGKSTMAKLLCGIVRPGNGSITLGNINASSLSIKEIGNRVGYVMQNPNQMLVKDIIKDEVALALTLRERPQEESDAVVSETLRMCGLYGMRNWPVSMVSYGQKKRVTVASILSTRPDIIILDEPTAGQDYRHYTEIMEFLDVLNRDYGITIIFITHDMHLAIEYTDRAVVFADGEKIADDAVFKVLANDDVIGRANLKQTSLYTLAMRLGISPEAFIQHFIAYETRLRNREGSI
ncbi:ABC transporter ATP-binding protein [Parasphaerochaeta coccoides]|uniref:Monosaccharide-transporting ATPase n=1 Tax=Parasphaerochaeta coccoides (strain ATCC BAA-1237 / DSM 17374 / SPN1) TaxID=760011 RepID=F4GHL0_PARC1|nr:ABC transporter ATP-binding protein [Parasphaerochaeta coccoides]AEC02599.1 Monosaccharide-transporting ATPase [Parasphaerochaeta coccoides DSM 17374]